MSNARAEKPNRQENILSKFTETRQIRFLAKDIDEDRWKEACSAKIL